jgi:predicted dehydrogenase
VAVCDTQEESLAQCRKQFNAKGTKLPKEYTGGVDAYKKMLSNEKLDAVIIATPWQFHKTKLLTQ